jgi:hypothetical protein
VGRIDPATGKLVVCGMTTVPADEIMGAQEIAAERDRRVLGFRDSIMERMKIDFERNTLEDLRE